MAQLKYCKECFKCYDLKDKIKLFFGNKLKYLQEFEDEQWLSDFAFLVNMAGHLSEKNKNLQQKDQLINNMYQHVIEFRMKLQNCEQLHANELIHFSTLSTQ